MTGPWADLREHGTLGSTAVRLVYETVDAVRRFDRYPPPDGVDQWTESAIQEFAHDFLFGAAGPERLAKLVATATSEDSFERVLEAAVRNEFRMRARRTDLGAVLRSLTHAVDRDGGIVVAGTASTTRTWSLPEHQTNPPYAGATDVLVEAAYSVPDVRRARWSSESSRRPPIAESESLNRVLRAVLDRAAAPVSPRLMADVIVARFPLALGGETELLDDLVPLPADNAAGLLASDAWDQLNDNERLVVGVLDLPVREMADAAGLSRSTAQRASTGARAVLSAFLADVDDQAGVVAALADASSALRARGTTRAGSASTSGEET
jgi:hypothetical protein